MRGGKKFKLHKKIPDEGNNFIHLLEDPIIPQMAIEIK